MQAINLFFPVDENLEPMSEIGFASSYQAALWAAKLQEEDSNCPSDFERVGSYCRTVGFSDGKPFSFDDTAEVLEILLGWAKAEFPDHYRNQAAAQYNLDTSRGK